MPRIELAFVGSVMPDSPEFVSPVFSRAGVMYQHNLLAGLAASDLVPSLVLSYRQLAAFPRGRPLFVRGEAAALLPSVRVRLLPFINATPVKQVGLGALTFAELLRWCWAHREATRVIHVFNLTVPPGIFVLLAARLGGAIAVVSLNDINEPGETVPDTWLNRFDFWMQERLIPRFDAHVVVADAIAEAFLPGRDYVRVEGGVTSQMLDRGAANSARIERGVFKMVLAGTLNEANGVRLTLEAMARIEDPHVRLCIAGRGPLEAEIRAAAAVDPRIEFLGFLPLDGVLALYRDADLLLNVRLTRTLRTRYFFPSKLMEFLASGTPVLTTCPAHVRDEYRDLAYLLTLEEPQALADMVTGIVARSSDERTLRAERARSYMAEHKAWPVQGRKVADFIRGVVARMS